MNALPFASLHFIRPAWLWALLALPLLAWLWRQRSRRENAWRGAVDAHLLPHLLEPATQLRARAALFAVLLAYALSILALAGPAWRQVPQPSWQGRTPLVVALDLSSATNATDLPPSRLLQARAKLATLLRERNGGQVGLVAFADDAYTVSPLTDDAANVALFLDALEPDVMPIDGHRPDRAIRESLRLLQQAGFERGDILIVTDHGDAESSEAAREAVRKGFRVSTLGLGAKAGSEVRSRDGEVERVSLDSRSLQALAAAGDGTYAALAPGDADLRALGLLQARTEDAVSTAGRAGMAWEDAGYWLLPPLMLLALFAFRRGAGVAALLVVLCLPPGLVHAQDDAVRGSLWRRADQVAAQRMEAGEQAYRKGDFARAEQAYDGLPAADAKYNLGNALAKQGRFEDAIAAYDDALRTRPGMPDALANKRAVENAMRRKPPQGGKRNDPRNQGGQDSGQKKQQAGDRGDQQTPPMPGSAQGKGTPQSQPQPQQAQSQPQQQPPQPGQAPKPTDAQAQRDADAAQRARMQRALQGQPGNKPGETAKPVQAKAETPAERERRLANDAWLRRVPDDPGGLLRAKFRLEYERRQQEGSE